jgi:hypothetical protein
MSDALRELLASFVIEVDKAGELVKGNAAVDSLKERLTELQDQFKKVKAPAAQAASAIEGVFEHAAQAAKKNLQAIAAMTAFGGRADHGGWGAAGADAAARAAAAMPQFGPTRDTLHDHQRAEFVADSHPGAQFGPTRETMVAGRAAAEAYAQTLRGKLANAVQAVRAGFNGAGGAGGKGPGLIASLATMRNGLLALGAGVVIHGVKSLVDSIGDISEGAARLGVTTDDFQRMSVYAQQNATDVGTLGTAFRTLATSAVDPTTETTAAFADLGVETTNTAGQFKTSQQLFFEVGEALAGVTNETVRTELAQKLLGRSAIALKPMFAQGTEAFRKQREEMLKLKVLSPDIITAADDLSDSWVALSAQLKATAGPVLRDTVFPALKSLTAGLAEGVEALGEITGKTDLTGAALAVLGTGAGYLTFFVLPPLIAGLGGVGAALGVITAEVVTIAAPILAAVAAFALLFDIIKAIRGKSSYIGDAVAAAVKSAQTVGFQPSAFMADTGGMLGQSSISIPGSRGGPQSPSGSTVVNANGDRNVTINLPAGSSPKATASALGEVLERDRDAIPAGVP